MNQFSRSSPKADKAEKLLLGACLFNDDVFPMVVNRLTSDDFYDQRHEAIWSAMKDLFDKSSPINVTTVSRYSTNEMASVYLTQLVIDSSVSLPRHVESWAEEIKNASRRRALISAAGKIAAVAYEEREATSAQERAREILQLAVEQSEDDKLLRPEVQAELLQRYVESLKEGTNYVVPTGYPSLDAISGGGLRRGDLIIVAARTSIGKSTYAENIAERVAVSGEKVLFVSVEMSPEQMMYRYAVRSGKVSRAVLEFGIDGDTDQTNLDELKEARRSLPFFILNAPEASVSTIKASVSRLNAEVGQLGLVVVDYLQLMTDSSHAGAEKEHLRIGQITKALKHMAREYNVPIILISQLNRNLEYRGGEPKLADLRESGRIEEDADLILMLWEMEKEDMMGNATKLKVAKNRQGEKKQLPIRFIKESFTFSEPHQ